MASKLQMVTEFSYHKTLELSSVRGNWQRYLKTAARIYKYPFRDQLLIHSQRPDVTACATIEFWNRKMDRWVNRGASGIALLDDSGFKTRLKYVFDVSDTHPGRHRPQEPQLWQMQPAYEEAVLEAISNTFEVERENETSFAEQIYLMSQVIAEDNLPDYLEELRNTREDSFLEDLDDLNLSVRLKTLLANSIAYTVLTRCGYDADRYFDETDFEFIHDFSTYETVSVLGNASNSISKMVLLEIGRTVNQHERASKFAKQQTTVYDTTMDLSAYSNYADNPEDEPDETGLRILKYETGTELPLSGARFEVIGPDGDSIGSFVTDGNGEIFIPLLKTGNYTVIEREAPQHYLISKEPAQNVTVVYDEIAEVTYFNDPYGSLRIEKKSNTGMNLPGAVITIEHIESGQTYTATTNSAGCAIFTEIKPGAYRVQEKTAPVGWELDDTIYTTTVVAGETTTLPIINNELPGLRIIKYDRKNYVAMPGVTFEVFRDEVSLGKFRTDAFGEILLTDLEPGTYRAVEVDTGNDGYILDTTPQSVELKAGDGIKELTFFNDMKPGMKLIKVDSADPSKVIPNAVFEIKSVAGDYGPEEFTTDEIHHRRCPAHHQSEAQ